MKKLFQILFFVLYPLIMYSQDSLRISTDTTRKPYFESVTFSAGVVQTPLIFHSYPDPERTVFPFRVQLDKIAGKNLITVGIWRTAFNNVDDKWMLEVDYHKMLVQRKFSLAINGGYSFDWGDSWYLGGSTHLGFNTSYFITPRLHFTLGVGSRFMHFGEGIYPFLTSPPIGGYANAGIKWLFKDAKRDTTRISKCFSALRLSRKLGVGLVLGVGGISYRGSSITYFHNDYGAPGGGYSMEFNPYASYRPYAFPYLQLTRATKKLHFHNIGFGFKKTYEFPVANKSYSIYYQYDLPLLKTKTSSALLYTGINCSANIQDIKFKSYYGYGDFNNDYTEISYNSHTDIASLNLPIGFKKQFGSSGVWFDAGFNLHLISFARINYDYEIIDVDNANAGPPPISTTYTYEKEKIDKFYSISPNLFGGIINSIYLKIILM